MLTTGNILMPQMRNPVASSNKPPTALKSAIIDGVVSGNISAAAHASVNWMISNGILITDTAIPSGFAIQYIENIGTERQVLLFQKLWRPGQACVPGQAAIQFFVNILLVI